MAVPVARGDGAACALVENKGDKVNCWSRDAEVPFRADRPGLRSSACRWKSVHVRWIRTARAPTAATTLTIARPTRRCWPVRRGGPGKAGAPAIHARPGNRMGPERTRLDPHLPRGAGRPGERRRLWSSSAKASRGYDVNTNGSKLSRLRWRARRWASRLNPATASACRHGVLRVRQQTHVVADRIAPLLDRSSPLRSSHLRAIRLGRRSTSPASRSWTRWRPRPTRIRSSSG